MYLSYSRIAFVIRGSTSSSLELASGNSNRILRSGSIGEDITVDLERFIRNYLGNLARLSSERFAKPTSDRLQ